MKSVRLLVRLVIKMPETKLIMNRTIREDSNIVFMHSIDQFNWFKDGIINSHIYFTPNNYRTESAPTETRTIRTTPRLL